MESNRLILMYNEDKSKQGFSIETWLYYMLGVKGDKFTGTTNGKLLIQYYNDNKEDKSSILIKTCMETLYNIKENDTFTLKQIFDVDSVNNFIKEFSISKEINLDLYIKFVKKYTSYRLMNEIPAKYKNYIIDRKIRIDEIKDFNSSIELYSLIIVHTIFDILFIKLLEIRQGQSKYDLYSWINLYRHILNDDVSLKKDIINDIKKKLSSYNDKYIKEDFKQILQNISTIADNKHNESPINETFFLENSIVSETNSHGIKQTDKIIVSFNSRFNNQVLVNVKTPKITKPIHVPISKELKDTPLKQKQLREKVILYKILGDNMLSTFYSELKIQTTDYFNHKIQGLTFRSLLSFNLKYYEGSIQTIGIICLKYLVNTNNIRFTLSKADLLNLNEYLSGI